MQNSTRAIKTSHKILATIGVIFALILIVPYFINWGSFKAPIVNAVKEATGRDLTIDGAIRITLLPAPTLKVENIKLSNVEGASTPDMVTLKSLDFHLSLLPLLKGKINIAKLELVEPIITLETLKDNRHSWDFTPKSKSPESSKAASESASSSIMAGLALQHVQIKNGSVVIKSPTSTQKIENIGITGQMQSLTGPYTIQGSLQSGETILKTEASAGKFSDNLPIKITLNINQNSKDFGTAQIEGIANLKEQKFSGKLNAPIAISTIIDLPQKKIDLNKGLSFTSDIDASANGVNLTNIKVAAEDIKVVGTASLLLPENKLVADLSLKAAGSDVGISIQGLLEDGFNGNAQLISKNPEGLISWFTTKTYSKIDLSSSVKTAKDSIRLDNISLVLGEASVKGKAVIATAKQEINADLETSDINPWLSGTASGKEKINAAVNLQVKNGENQTQSILANVKIFEGEVRLQTVIDNKTTENASHKVEVSAKNLVYANHKIDSANTTVYLKDGVLTLKPISVDLYRGKIAGEFRLETASNKHKMDLALSHIDIAQVLEKSSIHSLKKGELNGEIHLTAAGAGSKELISSLSGTTTVDVKGGTINNLNIKELIKRLKGFNNLADLPSLLNALNAKGETSFSVIKADFNLQNGQATSDNLTLISEDVEGTGKAIINLVQWIISVNANLKIKELSNFPPFAFKVEGSLSDPTYGLDTKQMQELLIKKGVPSFIGQFIGKSKSKDEKPQG